MRTACHERPDASNAPFSHDAPARPSHLKLCQGDPGRLREGAMEPATLVGLDPSGDPPADRTRALLGKLLLGRRLWP
eukprot:279592-Alexandrium_andersonii.AAC.1